MPGAEARWMKDNEAIPLPSAFVLCMYVDVCACVLVCVWVGGYKIYIYCIFLML